MKNTLWFCLALVLLSGCGRDKEATNEPTTVRLPLNSPRSLDPNLVSESEGGAVVENAFEGLFITSKSGRGVRPGVATSVDISDDGRVWTFHLRDNARWSDGEPVTAHDFEYSWKRLLDPATASEYVSIMKPIRGAEAYTSCADRVPEGGDQASHCEAMRDAVGARALDDHTFEVTLNDPDPVFRELVTFYSFLPVPKHVLERVVDGTPLGEGSRWTRPEHWVSNGAYVLTGYEDRVAITLEKNPHYWDQDAVHVDRVVLRIIEDAKARFAAFRANQLDMIVDVVPLSELRKRWVTGSEQLQIFPRLGVYMLVLNVNQPPFDDLRVRRALNLALDKGELVRFVTGTGEVPATGVVPAMLGQLTPYDPPEIETFNPALARQLMEEARRDGVVLDRLVYSYNTNENHKKIAEAVGQMWSRNLGIEVELFNMEWKVYLDQLKAGKFEVGRYGWIADYVDPMTFLMLFESDNPNNSSGWKSETYDQLLASVRATPDEAARLALMRDAEAMLMGDWPIIPIYYYSEKILIQPHLKGVVPHLLGTHLFRDMRLVEP